MRAAGSDGGGGFAPARPKSTLAFRVARSTQPAFCASAGSFGRPPSGLIPHLASHDPDLDTERRELLPVHVVVPIDVWKVEARKANEDRRFGCLLRCFSKPE